MRKTSLIFAFLAFPLTLYYFSPVLTLQGASEAVLNGRALVFGAMFVAALFVGRLWCGWARPAGALQEFAEPAQCTECQTCTRNCPMSLDVNAMVHKVTMEDGECILCGSCVDGCPNEAIRFSFSGGG